MGAASRGESGHREGNLLPLLFGLLAAREGPQDVIELHQAHGHQAEEAAHTADGIDKAILVFGHQASGGSGDDGGCTVCLHCWQCYTS